MNMAGISQYLGTASRGGEWDTGPVDFDPRRGLVDFDPGATKGM